MRTIHAKSNRSLPRLTQVYKPSSMTLFKSRTSYFWDHLSELDTLINQDDHAAPIRSPVRGRTAFSNSRGLRASVPFFPLLPPFCSRPIFRVARMRKTPSRVCLHRMGTLATQATAIMEVML